MKVVIYRGNQIHVYDDGSASAFVMDRYEDIEEIPCDSLEQARDAIDRHMGPDPLMEDFVPMSAYNNFEGKTKKKKKKKKSSGEKKEPFAEDSDDYMEAQNQIEEFFKRDGVDIAPYAYKLDRLNSDNTDADDLANSRSLFYKKLYHEENSEGYVYKFSPSELVRLQSMISSEMSLSESKIKNMFNNILESYHGMNERWANRNVIED